mgnify:CR=1 FL=1
MFASQQVSSVMELCVCNKIHVNLIYVPRDLFDLIIFILFAGSYVYVYELSITAMRADNPIQSSVAQNFERIVGGTL